MAAPSGDDHDEVTYVIFAIAGICGFFLSLESPGDSDCPRLKLIQSISQLSASLDAMKNFDETLHSKFQSSTLHFLLDCEKKIRDVRRDAGSCLVHITEDRSEILLLDNDLCEISHAECRRGLSWIVFGRSLISHFCRQSQREQELIRQLQTKLDDIYKECFVGPGMKNEADILRITSHCLERNALLGHIEYREGVRLLQQSHGNWQSPLSSDGLGRQATRRVSSKRNNTTGCAHQNGFVEQARTAWDVFQEFQWSSESENVFSYSILVVGDEGSGKTHLCNEMELAVHSSTIVIRPQLPLDFLQATVGEAENVLLSILGFIRQYRNRNFLVIFDDVEHIMEGNPLLESPVSKLGGNGKQPVPRLCFTLLVILDSIRRCAIQHSNILLVLTSNKDLGSSFLRFDRTFYLGQPNIVDRTALLSSVIGPNDVESEEQVKGETELEQVLHAELVDSMVGRSYAELLQYCRQAIEIVGNKPVRPAGLRLQVLRALKQHLQTMTPESLRCGVIDDYVEMRVLAANDLVSAADKETNAGEYHLTLRGMSAHNAWKALEFSVIIPLCRSRELQNLMNNSSAIDQRNLVGGVLLHGESGSGKSEIAFHCARYAAQLLPSAKLVDVNCTSMVHKEVGASEEAIRRLFKAARMAAPCILLLDGIENIAATRGNDATTEGTMDRVLSTLLVELDGVTDMDPSQLNGIAVIGITHDERLIDPALKRPGRLSPVLRLSCDWD